jgi:hypothetical protein
VRLFLTWQPAIRRKLIDQVRQMLAQTGEQIRPCRARMLAQRVERIAPQRIGQRYPDLVRTDPGLRDSAVSALLQFLDEVTQALSTLPAAAPPSRPPYPPRIRSLRLPPGLAPAGTLLHGRGQKPEDRKRLEACADVWNEGK